MLWFDTKSIVKILCTDLCCIAVGGSCFVAHRDKYKSTSVLAWGYHCFGSSSHNWCIYVHFDICKWFKPSISTIDCIWWNALLISMNTFDFIHLVFILFFLHGLFLYCVHSFLNICSRWPFPPWPQCSMNMLWKVNMTLAFIFRWLTW